MNCEACENFFNSNVRSAGFRLYKEAKVSFSKPSSLEIIAYVKPNFKVALKLESMKASNINVDCNCTNSKKGQMCKHIWAVFLAVFEKSPDFFDTINEILKKEISPKVIRPQSEAQILAKTAFKLKQADYRKQQYQKQKARTKEFKDNKKKSIQDSPRYPIDVQKALTYFVNNGFFLEDSLNENSVYLARKKLSRIFHPDVGGSHSEILELNTYSEVLLKFIGHL